MHHVGVKLSFLRELKEEGLIAVVWYPTEEMPADLFTKNLPGPAFNKHTQTYCGHDGQDN